MARVPIDQRPPIAQWLIRARESRGEGYTVDRFLADLAAEEGRAPSRSNYAQWESGAVTPRPTNLAPVIAFWGRRGIAAPGVSAPANDPTERMAVALERIAGSLDALRADIAMQQGMTSGAVETLGARLTAILERMPDGR